MTRPSALFLPLAAVLLGAAAFAACGGDDSSATTPASQASTGSTTTAVAQIPPGAPQVDQDGLAFHPDKLTVKSGETVYFKNAESALHTVDINGKNESGNMKKDVVFAWKPSGPGEYKITCEYHPQMHATITVQ